MPLSPEHKVGSLAAVVLAGGASSRMGRDKAFLNWEGRLLLQRQISLAHTAGVPMVWISGRKGVDYAEFGCPVVYDEIENAGPLAGLAASLRVAAEQHAFVLALAVDLPFMTADYLRSLAVAAGSTGLGVLPRRGEYFEPLAAVYPIRPTLAAVEIQLQAGRFALQELALALIAQGHARAREIQKEELPFFANWNDAAGPR